MSSPDHVSTLMRLRDRLSDLSMRNRSLRLVRLPKKRAFDLAWLDRVQPGDSARALAALLSGRKQSCTLLSIGGFDDDVVELNKGLNYLDRDVRLVEDERGVYDLSVGFGFLCGNIADAKYLQAPLFLLPRRLRLDRTGRDGTRWTLEPLGDAKEVNVNRTLLLALQRHADLTLDLERLEEEAEAILFGARRGERWLTDLLDLTSSALAAQGLRCTPTLDVWGDGVETDRVPGTQLIPALPEYRAAELPASPPRRFELRPHAVLSRFPLADTALLEDYNQLVRVLEANPRQHLGYAGALLGDATSKAELTRERLRAQPSPPRWQIEPSDESQDRVLARVLAGQSMAVYGPPGTGKSQLIANLVSSAVAEGKRVLVVSQKRPALDVVQQRLGSELDRFVALVHDPVRDRGALVKRIADSLALEHRHGGSADPSERDRHVRQLSEDEAWFEQVHQALVAGSRFEAYAYRMRYPADPSVLGVHNLPPVKSGELEEATLELEHYLADRHRTRTPNTWKRGRPDYSTRTEDDLERFRVVELPRLEDAIARAVSWADGRPEGLSSLEATAVQRESWEALENWASANSALPGVAWKVLPTLLPLEDPVAHVLADREVLNELARVAVDAGGVPLAATKDMHAAEERIREYSANAALFCRFLWPSWHASVRNVQVILASEDISRNDLTWGIQTWRARAAYSAVLASAPGQLRTIRATSSELAVAASHQLDAQIAAAWAAGAYIASWNALADAARRLVGAIPRSQEAVSRLQQLAAWALRAVEVAKRLELGDAALARWVGTEAARWSQRAITLRDPKHVRKEFQREVGDTFEDLAAADRRVNGMERRFPVLTTLARQVADVGHRDVTQELWSAYATRWVRDAEAGAPILRDVSQQESVRRRGRLSAAAKTLPQVNRLLLKAKLHDQVAALSDQDRAELVKRATQVRKRWPIRKMVEQLWSRGLASVLPVWLCSPETVAAVFPLTPGFFDYVVFDEASQCTLPQGLTAVYRGRTCVVAGDEQQLPPSNLFSTTLEDEEAPDEVSDEESLLSRAKVAGSDMSLSWHYRSRFPELIQFSNRMFYNGELRVSPLPVSRYAPPSIEWIQVPGDWARQANTAEGAVAVEILERFLRDQPGESIGVITVNRAQADHIQDVLDTRLQASPTFRQRFEAAAAQDLDARPFIRNLENVQGDERDVIILSVAYAPDATGRVPLRFGALSLPGGERRLNVAISRARKKVIVLCSFDPATQLVVSEGAARGAQVLRDYLLYARAIGQAGGDATAAASTVPTHASHTRVVDHLAGLLEARGWRGERSVGASAARVDLAVRSRRHPERFLLAILLDGPGASWTTTALGREVGRVEYLRRYQWEVFSVAARALVRSPVEVVDSLVNRLELLEREVVDVVNGPPTVQLPKPAPTPPRPPSMAPSADRPRAAARSLPLSGARASRPDPGPIEPPPVAAPQQRPTEPSRVRQAASTIVAVKPGCTVRYCFVESDEEREVVLAGPTVPRGVPVVALVTPLAQALLEAEVGEVVVMEQPHRSIDLRVLAIKPPPAMPA